MPARRTATVLILSAFLAASGISRATIIAVPGDEPSIQEGIAAATSGDTVLIAPDTYNETIDFLGKPVVVGSHFLTTGDPSYIAATIIDGDDTLGPLASFTSGEDSLSMLAGLTLQHGLAVQGGAVFCWGGSPRISDCVITSNEALSDGGGVYARECDPIIESCRIEVNEALNLAGGGLGVRLGSPRVTGCVFSGNVAHDQGGGIFCEDSSPVITDNVIDGNSSVVTYAGGIMSRCCTMVLARNIITNNDTNGIGGGLFY